jgi:hypothetical protein
MRQQGVSIKLEGGDPLIVAGLSLSAQGREVNEGASPAVGAFESCAHLSLRRSPMARQEATL